MDLLHADDMSERVGIIGDAMELICVAAKVTCKADPIMKQRFTESPLVYRIIQEDEIVVLVFLLFYALVIQLLLSLLCWSVGLPAA